MKAYPIPIGRFLTYSYLWTHHLVSLVCPATLSYDWQLGSVPLVTAISDTRNLATAAAGLGTAALARTALASHSRCSIPQYSAEAFSTRRKKALLKRILNAHQRCILSTRPPQHLLRNTFPVQNINNTISIIENICSQPVAVAESNF